MSQFNLPPIPRSEMFVGGVMSIEWQNFFRDLFRKIGVGSSPSIADLDERITDLEAGGGGATELDNLSDVSITATSDGQLLTYDSATGGWENWTPDYLDPYSTIEGGVW